ncbi:MAG: hypothetical protein ACI8PT_002708 [Gammaproteobacteria bacterium]|jgi:hypothetical protein
MLSTAACQTTLTHHGPCVNHAVLADLKSLVGNGISDIIAAFIDDAEHLLVRMSHAVESFDVKMLSAASEQLKSSSATLGALKFALLMQRVEATARAGETTGIDALVREATTEFSLVRTCLLTTS